MQIGVTRISVPRNFENGTYLKIMTWKELKDKISLMTEEEQRQEVAVWGENMKGYDRQRTSRRKQ